MNKKIYMTPCADYIEFVPESCLATSSPEEDAEVNGVSPDPWEKGNENWW